jgi:very-short-patch-repair endonuclease
MGGNSPFPPLAGEGQDGGNNRMNTINARNLRKNMTDAERALWRHLRLRQIEGHKFHRQQVLGPYIVDFACLDRKLIIEVDGGQHGEQATRDDGRAAWLEARGFRVLRFWNHEVIEDIEAVKAVIARALRPHPNPPQLRGEGGQSPSAFTAGG